MTLDQRAPVCVLGTGLIGGSLLRAAVAAGYDAFGYNRSDSGAEAGGGGGGDLSGGGGAGRRPGPPPPPPRVRAGPRAARGPHH
ncbi:hypothetical protein ACFWPJ_22335, partial [Nocardia sp. NPDC058497]